MLQPAPTLDVSADAFVSAAVDLHRLTFISTTNTFYQPASTLDACRSMAGSDPVGAAWTTSYGR